MKYIYGRPVSKLRSGFIVTLATAAILANGFAVTLPLILSSRVLAASPYDQGFEYDTSEWQTLGGTFTKTPSGSPTSSSGSFHGSVSGDVFTRWGGYRSSFPVGGYTTQVDIYLDTSVSDGTLKRIDFSSAINNTSGTHLRDLVTHIGTVPSTPGKFSIGASNNAETGTNDAGDRHITSQYASIEATGWYTISQRFYDNNGQLSVEFKITDKSGLVIGSKTISNTDSMSNVGGNRYGWFIKTSAALLEPLFIDNAKLTVHNAPQPTAPQNGGVTHTAGELNFEWNGVSGAESYEVIYSQGPSRSPNTVDGELSNILGEATTATNSVTKSGLPEGLIFWQVRGIFNGLNGPWSNIWSTTIIPPETSSSETLVVSADQLHGWEFNGDRQSGWTRGTGSFVPGPDTAPQGNGSAEITTDSISDREKLRKYLTPGTKISDIKNLKYSTYRDSSSHGSATTLALQIDVDFDSSPDNPNRSDARIVYEPYYTNPQINNTWQTWDTQNNAENGNWWIAGANVSECVISNPCTWSELNSKYSSLVVSSKSLENVDTSGAILFKAGGGWNNFKGNVDKLVLGVKTGNNIHTTTYDFEPANTPPNVTFESPTPTENEYVKGLLNFRATASDDYGMGSYYLRVWQNAFEIAGGGTLRQSCYAAPGAFNLGTNQDTSCNYDTSVNPDGTYVLSAQFLDGHNQWGQALRTINIDNTAPKYTIKPESIGNTANKIFRNVSFKLEDPGNGKIDRITLNGQEKDLTNNKWSDINNVKPGVFGAIEGLNTLVIFDLAGNATTYEFTLDTTAPDAFLVSPEDNIVVNGASITQSWGSNATDIAYFTYESFNDQNANSLRWRENFTNTSKTATNVADAIYWWRVKAIDSAGNESNWTPLRKITVDNTAPNSPLLGLQALGADLTNGSVTNSNTVKAIWNKPSDDTVKYDYQYWNDIPGNVYKETSPWSTETYSADRDGSFTEGEGKHFIRVRAIDAANNKSGWSNIFEINYDATAPIVTIDENTSPTAISTITGTVNDINARVFVIIDNGAEQEATNNNGAWTISLSPSLLEGSYSVTAYARDTAGNATNPRPVTNLTVLPEPEEPGETLGENTETPSNNNTQGNTGNPQQTATQPFQPLTGLIVNRFASTSRTGSTSSPQATDAEVLAESDDISVDELNRESAQNELQEANTLAATDTNTDSKSCPKILGVCWYWWIPVVIVVVLVIYYAGSRQSNRD